jgi:hypothetical protein
MAAGGAAAAAAIARAIKASGVVVSLDPQEFAKVVGRMAEPLVVYAEGGIFTTRYQYLTSYKGLAFFTVSREPLPMPAGTELITARRIWIPG